MPVSPSSSLSLSVSVSHYGPFTFFAPAKPQNNGHRTCGEKVKVNLFSMQRSLPWKFKEQMRCSQPHITSITKDRGCLFFCLMLAENYFQLLNVVINLSHTFRMASLLTHSPRVSLRIYLAARLSWTCTTRSAEEVWSRTQTCMQLFSGWTNLKSDNLGTRSVLSFVIFKSSHPVICQTGPSLGDTVRSDRCPLKLLSLDHTCHILTLDAYCCFAHKPVQDCIHRTY